MKSWKTENTKAIAILRVSSHRQKENTSHDIQEREVERYCEEEGLDLVHVARIVESAKDSGNRTQYKAAIAMALKKKIRHILFYMNDREARNLTDSERNEKLVKDGLVVIHYVRDKKVLHRSSSESDFMLRDFQAIQNKSFSRNLSVKVNDAMRDKAQQGWFPNNHAPLGYVHQKTRDEDGREKKRGTIITTDPDPKRVRWVQREFELRSEGLSYEKIRRQIIAEGFVKVGREDKYYVSAIEKRLKSPFYRGQFLWQGEIYDGKHELIIPRHILRLVDETFGLRQPYRRVTQDLGVFSGGWIRCAECSCGVIYAPKTKIIKSTGETKVFHYYRCTNGKKVHTTQKGMAVTEAELWTQFESVISHLSISEDLAKDIAHALNGSHVRRQETQRKDIEAFENALKNLDQKSDGIFDLFVSKNIDEPQFRRQNERIKDERLQILALLENAKTLENDDFLETAKTVLELAKNAKTLWLTKSSLERRELLESVLWNQVLNVSKIEYHYRKPFETLLEMSQKENWRSQPDLNRCIYRERVVS